jgi:O-acetyl-ADP-ribose deacetylase (regulator of RNase III)
MDELRVGGRVLALAKGDITTFESDAIVNAANSALAGGGGVDGAIHRRGGPSIMAELRTRHPQGCPTGSAVITGAGKLPAGWVVHAVGPIWRGGQHGEPRLLAAAYRAALDAANMAGARSVALAAISAGVYGYPLHEAARIGVTAARDHLAGETRLQRATFVLYSEETYGAFVAALAGLAAGGAHPGG